MHYAHYIFRGIFISEEIVIFFEGSIEPLDSYKRERNNYHDGRVCCWKSTRTRVSRDSRWNPAKNVFDV